MELLSIGAFAALTRLSPKALRLYADLGLLPPAQVDPVTGYRFYTPAQLERARLVAWLRRLGMPLATIRTVCDLNRKDAAAAISRFWAQVEAETAARRDLTGFLISELSDDRSGETDHRAVRLGIRYAVRSDTGLVRRSNQDAAYAGAHLLAVADGFGADGERAGTAAIDALRTLAVEQPISAGDLLNALQDAVGRANHAIGELAEPAADEFELPTGTTLTAMLWAGSRVALVHIGDCRVYLLRGGQLFQITHDHTFVQAMVDDGRLSPAEATSHPQRAMLLRALDGQAGPAADVRLHEARPDDRYLLCSDGLSAVVAATDLARVIGTVADPDRAVGELIALAWAAGAPDNVSCVIADVFASEPRQTGC
ncbi:MAG TPA: MerR family transcriptional regulator [Kineosporiaceae bacterium]|nr:MerR family transcriptional regulator [Kineosporiaceae bacterium]